MNDFFEFLRRRDLSPDRLLGTLNALGHAQLVDLVQEVRSTIPYTLSTRAESHSFVANTSLSGGAFPCADPVCRINRADDLARFASLYADRVLIRDPFWLYDESFREHLLKLRLCGDFLVLFYLEPLLRSGLVGIASPVLPFCAKHRSEERGIGALLDRVKYELQDMYMETLDFHFDNTNGQVVVTGPEYIVSHGEQRWGPFGTDVQTRKGLVRAKIKQRIFSAMLLAPAVEDVLAQGAYVRHGHHTYLTDRELDAELIALTTDEDTRPIADAVLKGLSHTVPIIEATSLEVLLRLRDEEGEAFRVYRDSVSSVLRTADLSSERRIKEAFADAIQPELHRIDLAVRNSTKLVSEQLTKELVIGAGLIGIGLFVGAVQPAAGAIVAAMGGGKFASELGKRAYDVVRPDTTQARENSYYYLWKLRADAELGRESAQSNWF